MIKEGRWLDEHWGTKSPCRHLTTLLAGAREFGAAPVGDFFVAAGFAYETEANEKFGC
jgi:hypothetical protein